MGLGGRDPTDLYLILSTGGFYLESYMGFFWDWDMVIVRNIGIMDEYLRVGPIN